MKTNVCEYVKTYVRYTVLNEANAPRVAVGDAQRGDLVTAVKFVNVGTNSEFRIGEPNAYETISKAGAPDVSFGADYPYIFQHEFFVQFVVTNPGLDHVHQVLMIETCIKN